MWIMGRIGSDSATPTPTPTRKGMTMTDKVYVVTDLFTRLGVPGGRYDRPEGRIANAR